MEKLIKKQTESEKRRTWAERKLDFIQWKKSLSFKKTQALACGITLLVLLVAFLIFNNLPVSYARHWDIEYGYYSILLTFLLLIVGFLLNVFEIPKFFINRKPSGKSIGILSVFVLIFSVFMFSNIENSHRVLSDETSWESMALQMHFEQSGGICNEGLWENGTLQCFTEVNNFKGKALGFLHSLAFRFFEPGRDTALWVNYPLYVLSLYTFFLALFLWWRRENFALAATIFLGGMPILLMQARSASTEVLYISLLTILMSWFALVPRDKVTWKHFLLTVPLLGFFAQTRQETVFAFIPFALYYYRYFLAKAHRLPLFVLSTILVCWPSINTMAAYRGYDFQGGEHAAHSLANFWFNIKSNILIMLNWGEDASITGILENPFYTTFTIILLLSFLWLLFRLFVYGRYIRGFILGLFFCIQILVILLNVSGTFEIDINQRYVLVALPLFAFIMALGLEDAISFIGKFDKISTGKIVLIIATFLSLGLMFFHAPSFRANMLYYKNKLLAEEHFLDKELESYPENSLFVYARPWQMLASRHSSISERTFLNWTDTQFSEWMHKTDGNIYLVRGQDGRGTVNRKSRVVGFKTTDQIETILEKFKTEIILQEKRKFGYPLTIYKVLSKRGVSLYRQKISLNSENSKYLIFNRSFPESVAAKLYWNGKLREEPIFSTNSADTLWLDSAWREPGLNTVSLECLLPDGDTLRLKQDYFFESEEASLVSNWNMEKFSQEWGRPELNKTVDQNQLTLGGEAFKFGIGAHAPSRLKMQVPVSMQGKSFQLSAVIGLDDESVCGDGAVFEIYANHSKVYRSPRLYAEDRLPLNISIPPSQFIELVTIEGENMNCDHTDWANIWARVHAGELK